MFRMMMKVLTLDYLTLNTVEPSQTTNEPPKTKSWLYRGITMQQFAKKTTKTELLGRFKSEITDSIEIVNQAPTRISCKG